jgi:hypothetical protein
MKHAVAYLITSFMQGRGKATQDIKVGCLVLCSYSFSCSFNHAVSSSHYLASNIRMDCTYQIELGVKESYITSGLHSLNTSGGLREPLENSARIGGTGS